MDEALRNQYGGEIHRSISKAFPEGYKNLEIIKPLGDNFNITWGGVKAKT